MYTIIPIIFKRLLNTGVLLLAYPLSAFATLPQSEPVPGGIAVIPIGSISTYPEKPQSWIGDQQVLVTADQGLWYAVVGIALDEKPGSHELRVATRDQTIIQHFEVNAKAYPEQHITLKDKSKVQLSPADEERAGREIAVITNLKHHWQLAPETDLEFMLPAQGELTSRFGLRRFFNEEPRSPHAGLDLAVNRGTPVKASSEGKVLAVDDYFFNGKTIFLDHGNGLITMYCHLDKFDVKTGDSVIKGQQIGRSGKTGRATGPHLHWSVILNGAMVDPELFISSRPSER